VPPSDAPDCAMTIPRALVPIGVLALAWLLIWGAIGATLSVVIGIVDPPSIDAGEGPLDMARVVGTVGAGCGALFGLLLAVGERRRPLGEVALWRALGWGVLAGAALPLITPLNDVLVTNTAPFAACASALCSGVARARCRRRSASPGGPQAAVVRGPDARA